jgi:hypothetical protein
MEDSTASKLETAYALIKAGQHDQAYKILIPLVRANPQLADGWFLLGHAVSDSRKKIQYFRKVLSLDPANQAAQKQLAKLLAQEKSAKKKQGSAFPWKLAGWVVLFVCLSSFVLLWVFSNPIFSSRAPAISGNAAPIPPAVASVTTSYTPEPSLTSKPTSRPTVTIPANRSTSLPSEIPTLTRLPGPSLTPLYTPTPSPTITPTPKKFNGCLAPNGLGALTALFKIENFGKDRAMVIIKGASRNGNYSLYCQAVVKQGKPVFLTLAWGNYEYLVLRGSTTRRGNFYINQPYKSTMRVFKDKIQIGPFP